MWHDVEQNKPEWDLLRVGKITSSALAKVMANYGKAFGEPAKKYASEIALGQITGKVPASGGYSNSHMERGHEEEHLAISEYENRYFSAVTNGGFYEVDDEGCSPDGLVGDDGMIEVKSAIPSMHFARVRKQSFDPAYKWQYIDSLKISGRDWLDFISYCADYPEGKRIYVYRLLRADFSDEFEMIDTRLAEFREVIEEAKEIILNNNYSLTNYVRTL
jgi:hypothetical protein